MGVSGTFDTMTSAHYLDSCKKTAFDAAESWEHVYEWDVSRNDFTRYATMKAIDSPVFNLASFGGLCLRFFPFWDARSSLLKMYAPHGTEMSCSLWLDDERKDCHMPERDEGNGYSSVSAFFSQVTCVGTIWAALLDEVVGPM